MSRPKLFLLDAYALIFRAHFAFARNPRITREGLDTSAVYGFMLALLDVIEKQDPTHLGVVFDKGGSHVRTEMFPEYKANRDETPEGIRIAVPYIHQLLEAMNVPAIWLEGYEADDLIGTLAGQAEKEGFDVFMMTPDKDFGQLVTDHIKMFKPARGGAAPEVMGPAEVCAKWDIERVSQVVDMLGMMGDASDNIPGLPGVGEKTAAKLLKQYGSLENTLANAEEIKGKLGERIRDNAELGTLSKELARILTDAPITLDAQSLEREEPNMDDLTKLFEILEFRSLARRLNKKAEAATSTAAGSTAAPAAASAASGPAASAVKPAPVAAPASGDAQLDLFGGTAGMAPAPEAVDHTLYQMMDTEEGLALWLGRAMAQPLMSMYAVVSGDNFMQDDLLGLAFSWEQGSGYYVPLTDAKRLQTLKPLLESEQIGFVGHDIKVIEHHLLHAGIELRGPRHDSMIAHYLLEPDRRHRLDDITRQILAQELPDEAIALGPKGKSRVTWSEAEPAKVKLYAAACADMIWQLHGAFAPQLASTQVDKVMDDMEAPLIPVLTRMEEAGVRVDLDGLAAYSEQLGGELAQLQSEIYEIAGQEFNLGSPRQLGQVLFDDLKISSKAKKTKTGQYATGEEILEGFRKDHPIVDKILDWRQVGKLKSTYVDALPLLVNPDTGRIHSTFNQAVAATGRLSSTNPNLQNIPIRTERGRKVRELFVPRDEAHVLLAADYSQIELRVIASMSGDPAMLEAFSSGADIHASTAAKVFGVPLEEVSREQRSHAKTVNFGIIYGVSAFGLAQQTSLSRTEAKEIIESYFQTYPGIKKYIDDQVAQAREKGYVETLLGRRRYLRDINSRNGAMRGHAERNAINAPIQGTAADIVKLAMLRVDAKLREEGFKSPMILQVHDELVFDVRRDELDALRAMVASEMEQAFKLEVPLVVDTGVGENWLQAH